MRQNGISEPRKPAAFRIEPEAAAKAKPVDLEPVKTVRKPRAAATAELIHEADVFDQELETMNPPPAKSAKRHWTAWTVFLGATATLLSLAAGLWLDTLIRNLFARADWLGYAAFGILGLGIVALLVIAARELAGLAQLNVAETIRAQAADAIERNDAAIARNAVDKLEQRFATVPQTARGRQILAATRSEVMGGADLMQLTEQTLLKPLDDLARTMILDSAKRVSVVTAISPRALVDVAYVVFECARLIRRLAELYGGRPGTLGLIKLSKNVIAHLAVTGSIAVGDSVIQQLVGHGVAAKISARFGEGVINGLMTARIGVSAMDLVRPMAFTAEKRPGISDFLSELGRMGNAKTGNG
ncbi:MAG: YcjF family protein [Rhizobiaceae bacterium]